MPRPALVATGSQALLGLVESCVLRSYTRWCFLVVRLSRDDPRPPSPCRPRLHPFAYHSTRATPARLARTLQSPLVRPHQWVSREHKILSRHHCHHRRSYLSCLRVETLVGNGETIPTLQTLDGPRRSGRDQACWVVQASGVRIKRKRLIIQDIKDRTMLDVEVLSRP